MPGIALLIEGAIQHAAHKARQEKSGVRQVLVWVDAARTLSSKEPLLKKWEHHHCAIDKSLNAQSAGLSPLNNNYAILWLGKM
jgi:hypothetical protein